MTRRAIEHKIVMEHITQLGKPKPAMLEWVNSLPPKMRSRIDWL